MGIWFLIYCMKEIVQKMRNLFMFFQLNFFLFTWNEFFTKRLTCAVYMLKVGWFVCVLSNTLFPYFPQKHTIERVEFLYEGTNTLTSNHVKFKNRLLNSVFFITLIKKQVSVCTYIFSYFNENAINCGNKFIKYLRKIQFLKKYWSTKRANVPDMLTGMKKNYFFKANFWVWRLLWEYDLLVSLANEKRLSNLSSLF